MIERADISGVLMQIRSAQGQINSGFSSSVGQGPLVHGLREGVTGPAGVQDSLPVKEVPSFASLLKQAIDNVNGHQQTANDLRTRYELGDPDVDIVNVMIASQKATVAFEAMSQVRSRLVGAYQEIMRMPI
ncbi:flagellar hook-basal body complex protein FliE [Marinospirillum alkaliphilum]|uniref:Flagellar hook-basal body complex protein FliE n=1 Tax=Marinospirillum alkaliphilum DSM 21637 TaxID=1122209 RepID=A0A1K1VAG6_9GAMM|nr:flagellar hook-basal body complex protein FliE [Marinospirillum alkaliphilum]SFX22112.1 flagellar hook-basal body complex protein FliE [Marinospirillum alkaliphilum DSM 21637]